MLDKSTTIDDLRAELRAFRDAREWEQFHSPANLAQAITVEAGELQECFLWGRAADIEHVTEELADVLIYCLNMANALGVDVTSMVLRKIHKNGEKYPA